MSDSNPIGRCYGLSVGDIIECSDGTPIPPAHHRRKRAAWLDRNFTGVCLELESPCSLFPNGSISMTRDGYDGIPGCIEMKFTYPLGGSLRFSKAE